MLSNKTEQQEGYTKQQVYHTEQQEYTGEDHATIHKVESDELEEKGKEVLEDVIGGHSRSVAQSINEYEVGALVMDECDQIQDKLKRILSTKSGIDLFGTSMVQSGSDIEKNYQHQFEVKDSISGMFAQCDQIKGIKTPGIDLVRERIIELLGFCEGAISLVQKMTIHESDKRVIIRPINKLKNEVSTMLDLLKVPVQFFIQGNQNAGKTTLTISIIRGLMKDNPEEGERIVRFFRTGSSVMSKIPVNLEPSYTGEVYFVFNLNDETVKPQSMTSLMSEMETFLEKNDFDGLLERVHTGTQSKETTHHSGLSLPENVSAEEREIYELEGPLFKSVSSLVAEAIKKKESKVVVHSGHNRPEEMYDAMAYGCLMSQLFTSVTIHYPGIDFAITDNPGMNGNIKESMTGERKTICINIVVKNADDTSDLGESNLASLMSESHMEKTLIVFTKRDNFRDDHQNVITNMRYLMKRVNTKRSGNPAELFWVCAKADNPLVFSNHSSEFPKGSKELMAHITGLMHDERSKSANDDLSRLVDSLKTILNRALEIQNKQCRSLAPQDMEITEMSQLSESEIEKIADYQRSIKEQSLNKTRQDNLSKLRIAMNVLKKECLDIVYYIIKQEYINVVGSLIKNGEIKDSRLVVKSLDPESEFAHFELSTLGASFKEKIKAAGNAILNMLRSGYDGEFYQVKIAEAKLRFEQKNLQYSIAKNASVIYAKRLYKNLVLDLFGDAILSVLVPSCETKQEAQQEDSGYGTMVDIDELTDYDTAADAMLGSIPTFKKHGDLISAQPQKEQPEETPKKQVSISGTSSAYSQLDVVREQLSGIKTHGLSAERKKEVLDLFFSVRIPDYQDDDTDYMSDLYFPFGPHSFRSSVCHSITCRARYLLEYYVSYSRFDSDPATVKGIHNSITVLKGLGVDVHANKHPEESKDNDLSKKLKELSNASPPKKRVLPNAVKDTDPEKGSQKTQLGFMQPGVDQSDKTKKPQTKEATKANKRSPTDSYDDVV